MVGSHLALIDYGSGNLRSAEKALLRAAADMGGGPDVVVTSDAGMVAEAARIVLPGVGAFGDCMAGLAALPGMREALDEAVLARGVPFLGICVGMQLLATKGYEFGEHKGLGWITGEVRRLAPGDAALKVPHMGWNELQPVRDHALLRDLGADPHVYFVHSFAMTLSDPVHLQATTDYGGAVTAAIARDNIAGVQFHPEKSQRVGLKVLQNFLAWRP
ncbi:MAG TPA: imidazole glycerol phosphate synthase subunit HisH [Rhizomicrobium sp.]|jgi:glutamine amidotransferase